MYKRQVKYDAVRGQTLTAYFLGKVWVARHLEPQIPEKCLIAKLSYHFGEDIVRARRCGQIKTIGEMEALLEGFEREDYYRRSRRRPKDRHERNKDQPHDNRQPVNHVRTDGYNRNATNRRFQGRRQNLNNEGNCDRRYGRDNDNRRQWNDNGEVSVSYTHLDVYKRQD